MTTIFTPTADGVVATSSLAGAKVGRFCRPPHVPDRCYECFDVVDGSIVHRPATGYVDVPEHCGVIRYGACPACWAQRTKRPYRHWIPGGTWYVYRAVQESGRWRVYAMNAAAACTWTRFWQKGYLAPVFTGPYGDTTLYLTEKAMAEAEEYFIVQDEQGSWHTVHADGTPTICFNCGEENDHCVCRR